uniref:Odorant receptor n=1 Tax=Anoplophora chinensis TaxID=217632 RepID=A0A2H4ZB96_ANOCN|nr:odorant receptor [Anoplophora chinensis]
MERLKICVRHHCRLLKYGKNLDRNSSSILLLQLLMSYLAMVINGYILTSNKAGTLQTVEICSYTMTIFTEFVVFSVQASDLKDQSITVVDAVALSEWYLFKAPIKKALALLTMNAEKSIVITVGGMIEADNSLIIEVVLKAFSAITLLKALTIEEGQ